ncbi:MAG: ABC-F family ATP-binding cassette domain-containing protein [Bdellovibrionales bacterium]
MGTLLSANKLSKSVGDKTLFDELSFGVFEREKIGLIGPNGSGKSTLLKILSKTEVEDSGEITYKKNLALAFVPQTDSHPKDLQILHHTSQKVAEHTKCSVDEAEVLASTYLSITGFEDTNAKISTLSGGWLKRLSLAIAIATEPELLILDEPTNHMDWDGVLWLEGFLKSFKQSFILVSHDRSLLENTTNRTIEINPAFQDGFLSYNLGYTAFLDKKDEHLKNQQTLQASMANKARRETDWLRAGVKARTTKSRSRINEAHELIADLSDLNAKNQSVKSKVSLEIDSTGRKTKKLVELKNLCVGYENLNLIEDLSLTMGPKQCFGLLGHNGSGKTSFLKTLNGELKATGGSIKTADDLKIVYFEQKRSDLPQEESLAEFLGDGSDYVIFKESSVHVASYASRFLFSADRLNIPIKKLSGGEQARLLIAKLFLQPADVLILDEPTNDLDIKTISILEDIILSFNGLALLVSHDRFFLRSVCTHYLALDGKGEAIFYADVGQWLKATLSSSKATKTDSPVSEAKKIKKPSAKLSYKDKKFLEDAENIILEEEDKLTDLNTLIENAVSAGDSSQIQELSVQISKKQEEVEALYTRWDSLNKIKEGL